jgi:hypothetical protein
MQRSTMDLLKSQGALSRPAVLAHSPHRPLASGRVGELAQNEFWNPLAMRAMLGAGFLHVGRGRGRGRGDRRLEEASGRCRGGGAQGSAEWLSGEGGSGALRLGGRVIVVGEVIRVRVDSQRGVDRDSRIMR